MSSKKLKQTTIHDWFLSGSQKKRKRMPKEAERESCDIDSVPAGTSSNSQDVVQRRQSPRKLVGPPIINATLRGGSGVGSFEPDFLGLSLNQLRRTPTCSAVLSKLSASPTRVVLFQVTKDLDIRTTPPLPSPVTFNDKWDSQHVRMPCSLENKYPVAQSEGELQCRWQLVASALGDERLTSSVDLEEAILHYNSQYAGRWKFRGLHQYFTDFLEASESMHFFTNVLPKMVRLCLDLPKICTAPVPLLRRQKHQMICITQQQAASLLCNAFFCTFPRRNAVGRKADEPKEFDNFPLINFNRLYSSTDEITMQKLNCLVHYFRCVTDKMPTGTLSFERRVLSKEQLDNCDWGSSSAKLTRLHVSAQGTIEDLGEGMLQMDFANRFLGGGVLTRGCVQEEIRFLICPEMILSCLFTEALEPNECLVMTGCERFSLYDGYADSFQWLAGFTDNRPRDSWGRLDTEVVALDAQQYAYSSRQFQPGEIQRELVKAFSGFYVPNASPKNLSAIATGNWGCGAFGGDKELKCIIQLLAAAEAKRDLAYFTFGDSTLMQKIFRIHSVLTENHLSVGDIYQMLEAYSNQKLFRKGPEHRSVFEYIYARTAKTDSPFLADEGSDADACDEIVDEDSHIPGDSKECESCDACENWSDVSRVSATPTPPDTP